jgi:hypothetical protein
LPVILTVGFFGVAIVNSYPYICDHWSANASSKLTACRLEA